MPYVAPTATDLKLRFPEFLAVENAFIDILLEEAASEVDATWIEGDRARAMLYFVAHSLALEGGSTRSEVDQSSTVATGGLKRLKVGGVEEEYATASDSANGSSSPGGGFDRTTYGQHFLRLRARSHPAVLVV